MVNKLYLMLLIVSLFWSCNNHHQLQLVAVSPEYDFQDSSYISLTDQGVLLPTSYLLKDEIDTFLEDVIEESDLIFPISEYREVADTVYLKGDTLHYKGDSVPSNIYTVKHDTEIILKEDGIYIHSNRMLSRCQINLEYSYNAIYNKTFGGYSDRSNKTLDFLRIDNGKYIYFATYDTWESGGFEGFKCMTIYYEPEYDKKNPYGIDQNRIYFNKEDFGKYFPYFKAHLLAH